jgi:hypothetical protein
MAGLDPPARRVRKRVTRAEGNVRARKEHPRSALGHTPDRHQETGRTSSAERR